MSFKPWKPLLLTAVTLGAGATAATAQDIAAAQKAIELERYNEARGLLRNASSPEANYEMGRLYQMRDLDDSAAIYFNKAAGPTPFGQVAAGRAALVKGQADAAATSFDAAAKATKNKDAKVLTMIAQAYGESDVKNIDKALTYVNAAQTANKGKDEPALMVARGEVYLHSDTGGGEAMTSFDRATMANPNYAQAYYKKGELNVRSRNAQEAITNLEKAIQLEPKYAPAYKELAEMYYYAQQYPKALSTFEQYRQVAERSTSTDAEYASFLYLTKKFPEALTEVNNVLAKEPNNVTMNRLKAYTLYETGDYAGAATAMENYLRTAPAEKVIADDYAYQSRILGKNKKPQEALAAINKAIELAPASKKPDFEAEKTKLQMMGGDYSSALGALKDKAKNGDLADQYRLAAAYASAKQYPQADSVFGIINTAKADYAPAYIARAKVNVALDPDADKGLAKPYYEKYIELGNADPAKYKAGMVEAYDYLGAYNAHKNNKAAAKENFEKAVALDPTDDFAVKSLKIINGASAPARKPAAKPAAKAAAKK
ncbi:tetratricopeptide repeat protein [Hymenobacter setariae]|uniref:Tetratricopeptide repeat protein n=1 Tax=Hymenobacter setariae TaxID=2594794 RepID=A0A558BV42_9BACT|nr:tetratricopeptide repeat protein [Hymenobacter setariae]TVT40342.1 tetratricopeptide repeat protein [Hymenobacter setariae]